MAIMDNSTITVFIIVIISMIAIASLFAIQIDELSNEIVELESQLETCQISVELCTEMYNEVRP